MTIPEQAVSKEDREIMGAPEVAHAALIEKAREWRTFRQPSMATAGEHRHIEAREHQVRFELANAVLHWLWHEENPVSLVGVKCTEDVARIIDPHAFKSWQSMYDYSIKRAGDNDAEARRCADYFHKKDIDEALAKAAAILALPHTAQPQEGIDVNSREAVLWSHNMKLKSALEFVRGIIKDGAVTGFNCKDGDWAERLFASQAVTHRALSAAPASPREVATSAVDVALAAWHKVIDRHDYNEREGMLCALEAAFPASPQRAETAAVKNLVLASAALIADWSADCKVEDSTIAKLLEAYNAIGSQRLLLSEVEREISPAPPVIAEPKPIVAEKQTETK